jgi:hypothetical protein
MAKPLGPAQEAIRVMALHLPTGRPRTSPTPAPAPAAPSTSANADEIVLKSLMTAMGHGGLDHPAHDTTVNALLGALTRGRP